MSAVSLSLRDTLLSWTHDDNDDINNIFERYLQTEFELEFLVVFFENSTSSSLSEKNLNCLFHFWIEIENKNLIEGLVTHWRDELLRSEIVVYLTNLVNKKKEMDYDTIIQSLFNACETQNEYSDALSLLRTVIGDDKSLHLISLPIELFEKIEKNNVDLFYMEVLEDLMTRQIPALEIIRGLSELIRSNMTILDAEIPFQYLRVTNMYLKEESNISHMSSVALIEDIVVHCSSSWKFIHSFLRNFETLNKYCILSSSHDLATSLASYLCTLITNFPIEIPADFRKQDIYALMFTNLSSLLIYNEHISRSQSDLILSILISGLHKYGSVISRICINTLHLASYQFQHSLTRNLPSIVMKLSQITSRYLCTHILEFLASVARNPNLFVNFGEAEHKRVLGIALQLLNFSKTLLASSPTETSTTVGIESYLFQLSYDVITNWFLCLKISERTRLSKFIVEHMNSLSTVSEKEDYWMLHDMLNHVLFFGDSKSIPAQELARVDMKGRDCAFVGNAICCSLSDKIVLVRRPYGNRIIIESQIEDVLKKIGMEEHSIVELDSNTETFVRGMRVLDKIPDLELNKVAVMYVRKGQSEEKEVLRNTFGSLKYQTFLNELGDYLRLKDTTEFTGGLDTVADLDGKFAITWRDELSQLLFHVTTLMPNSPTDLNFVNKKRHTGNDHVTILFLDDSEEFEFGNITSQFNYVQILISSISQRNTSYKKSVFKVWMQRASEISGYGPLQEPKFIQGEYLTSYVRSIALHANLYARILVGDGEFVSNARERLRQIRRIVERARL